MNHNPRSCSNAQSPAQLRCVAAILIVHAFCLAWIAIINAPVFDEIAHVPSGLSHWKTGEFELYRVNPPLMRMIVTVPLLVANPKTDYQFLPIGAYARPEFVAGRRFLLANGGESFWYFALCRWAQIPVSILGGWICFRWSRELFGVASGFVGLILWCFCPTILAWGATVTPDMGGAAFGVTAAYAFWHWLNRPSWKSSLISGLLMGAAELAKSTWILLFALWPALWIVWRFRGRIVQDCDSDLEVASKPPVVQLIWILCLGLYSINLGYGFEGSCRRLDTFHFISQSLGGADAHETPGNRFRGTWLGRIPVPVPAEYLKGIDVQKFDFEKGKWSYLRGEYKLGGWWYYYLYAIAVKTPLGTLSLLAIAIVCFLGNGHAYRVKLLDEIMLIVPLVAILFLVSSQTGFNRYIRYIIPIFPFAFIFVSRVGRSFALGQHTLKVCCVAGVVASIASSLCVLPHSMSYFNLMADGPRGGTKHLLDANIDWGQDLLELRRFVNHHPEIDDLHLVYFGLADPSIAGFAFDTTWTVAMPDRTSTLKPGWYAVSVNHVFGYRHNESDKPIFTWFQQFVPDGMAGYSIYLYHLTAEKIENAVRNVVPADGQ